MRPEYGISTIQSAQVTVLHRAINLSIGHVVIVHSKGHFVVGVVAKG